VTNKITRNVHYNNYSTCQQLFWLVNDVSRLLPARRSQRGATVLGGIKTNATWVYYSYTTVERLSNIVES